MQEHGRMVNASSMLVMLLRHTLCTYTAAAQLRAKSALPTCAQIAVSNMPAQQGHTRSSGRRTWRALGRWKPAFACCVALNLPVAAAVLAEAVVVARTRVTLGRLVCIIALSTLWGALAAETYAIVTSLMTSEGGGGMCGWCSVTVVFWRWGPRPWTDLTRYRS